MASSDPERTASGPAYRSKLMHTDGRIETTVAIMASDEREALEQVRGLALSYTVELWDEGRLIATMMMRKRA